MSFMDSIKRAVGYPDAPAEPDPPVDLAVAQRTPIQKVRFHIDRFERALEQCTKGPEREAELRRHLDYWRKIDEAHRGLEGGE